MGSDAISRQIVSALSYSVGHPAGVGRLFDMSKTYTSSVGSSVGQQGEKKGETHRRSVFFQLTDPAQESLVPPGWSTSQLQRKELPLSRPESQSGDGYGGEC